MPSPTVLIGISGPSCAGKGTLTSWLAERIDAEVLPLDAYYHPLDHLTLEQRALVNFDEPSSLDDALLEEHLQALLRGETVQRPIYDFANHTRKPESITLRPARFVILEGLFTFYWDDIRRLLSARLFITAPDDICLDRRVERDQRERGRSELSVRRQYADTVEPMRHLFIDPCIRLADLVLDGTQPVDNNGARVLHLLGEQPGLSALHFSSSLENPQIECTGISPSNDRLAFGGSRSLQTLP